MAGFWLVFNRIWLAPLADRMMDQRLFTPLFSPDCCGHDVEAIFVSSGYARIELLSIFVMLMSITVLIQGQFLQGSCAFALQQGRA
ncbi:MAG: hypothetical protein R2941_18550 [Desulfobacterales bacterium]